MQKLVDLNVAKTTTNKMPRTHFTKAKLRHRKTVTESCWDVNIEGQEYTYTEYVDQKDPEIIEWTLRNQFGRDIDDSTILEFIQEAIVYAN